MFEDMLTESERKFKKGDKIRSRLSGRIGTILDLHMDQMHATVRWDDGAQQKLTTAQLIRIDEPRFKSAADQRILSAFDYSFREVIGPSVDTVAPDQFDSFNNSEILEIGDVMRTAAGISISPRWIKDELIRRGYTVES